MRLLTAPGLAGVAVVVADADQRTQALALLRTPDGMPLSIAAGDPPRRAALFLAGRAVDDVLVVDRGRRGLEIHLHGAPAVLEQVDRCLGLRVAVAGSPADRLLREAQGSAQLELAVEQMQCDFAAAIESLRGEPPAARRIQIAAALARSRVARALTAAQRVVLVGRQNAGKSSLFNRLLLRERALTGVTPGLTRDAIAETTVLDGYPYELVDTAGEADRQVAAIDRRAIAGGRAWRSQALTVLVVDAHRGPVGADFELARICDVVVAAKSDLPPAAWPDRLPRHGAFSATATDASATAAGFGAMLTAHRGLPHAGAVGGFAALSVAQWRCLTDLDADCGEPASPA